jgi:uncharacterized RDD family membrane protein YckC
MRLAWIAVLAAMGLIAAAMGASSPGLTAAASEDHVWLVTPRLDGSAGWVLLHHSHLMGGPHFRMVSPLAELPEAMAAWGESVWLIYPKIKRGEEAIREVVRQSTVFDPLTKRFQPIPADRFEIEPSLQGIGSLWDFVGTPQGPVAAISSHQGNEGAGECLQLRDGAWKELPRRLWAPDSELRLGWQGMSDGSLVVIATPKADRSRPAKFRLDSMADAWVAEPLVLPEGDIESLTRLGGSLAAVVKAPDQSLLIGYLRSGSLVELSRLEPGSAASVVVGDATGAKLIQFNTRRELKMTAVDRVTGESAGQVLMTVARTEVGEWIHMPLVGAMTLLLLIVAAVGDLARGAPPDMAQLNLVPLGRKIVALGIDLLPAAAATLLILRCPLEYLWNVTAWTAGWTEAWPYVLMAMLASAQMTGGELFTGRSLGLWVMGGQVATYSGDRPGVAAILIRNAIKFLSILSPILAMVAVLNRRHQGLGDVIARIVVVGREIPQPADRAKDAEGM